MASYDIHFSCGHDGTQQLVGPHKERDRKIAYFERAGSCPACFAAEQAKVRAEDRTKVSVAAATESGKKGLPALIGTPKQVAWAETLRQERLRSVMTRIAHVVGRARAAARKAVGAGLSTQGDVDALVLAVEDAGLAFVATIVDKADAKYWIDARGIEVEDLVQPVEDSLKREIGSLQQALDERERAADEVRRAEAAARAAASQAERDEERARSIVKARTFKVDLTPGRAPAVIVTGGDIKVRASDGRIAKGFVDAGDWAIYQIGEHVLPSTHPEAERIAHEARALYIG